MKMKNTNSMGFTLLELIVVIAIITLLAGVLTPLVKNSLDDAKNAKAIALIDTIKKAAMKFWYDTDGLAEENATTPKHNLFATTGAASWKGPYIDAPLTKGTNPWGSNDFILDDDLAGETATADGYLIAGAAQSGKGGELRISGVPDALAIKLDQAIDGTGVANPDKNGLCEYSAAASGVRTVYIFLFKQQ